MRVGRIRSQSCLRLRRRFVAWRRARGLGRNSFTQRSGRVGTACWQAAARVRMRNPTVFHLPANVGKPPLKLRPPRLH